MKSKIVGVKDMDFISGVDEVIADTYDEPPPKNIWEKFWLWIVSVLNPFLPPAVGRSPYSLAFTVLGSISGDVFNLFPPKLQRFSLNKARCAPTPFFRATIKYFSPQNKYG